MHLTAVIFFTAVFCPRAPPNLSLSRQGPEEARKFWGGPAFSRELFMSTIPLTKRGADMLRDELQRLKSVERPAVINSIAEARAQGDLSENAEYDAAKEKQGFIEGRIAEIESKLAGAQVIDPSKVDADGRVVFGATLELEDLASGASVKYQIVGDDEADIDHGLISISSPIARALIGKSEGDVASVQAPGGVREYEIIAVSYV
ncbi:Transcription elongation factor GreA [Paraburkholderia rhynchosiae]|uniref:Transcription elongation factor GreA n=2 Tax=Paraburkholderia rhynchosiae TaxID=487049 RepID=A0A6J5ADA3_9BURK|nr:Transcription elongation factor GreA [Paraburkholderia rhynchosiae]